MLNYFLIRSPPPPQNTTHIVIVIYKLEPICRVWMTITTPLYSNSPQTFRKALKCLICFPCYFAKHYLSSETQASPYFLLTHFHNFRAYTPVQQMILRTIASHILRYCLTKRRLRCSNSKSIACRPEGVSCRSAYYWVDTQTNHSHNHNVGLKKDHKTCYCKIVLILRVSSQY